MNLERRQTPTTEVTRALRCLRCGSAIKPGRKFCSQCGSPVDAASEGGQAGLLRWRSICLECGFENHRSDRFCKACGGLLAEAGQPAMEQSTAASTGAPAAPGAQPLPMALEAMSAAAVEPTAKPAPSPANEPVLPEVPFYLQRRRFPDRRLSVLRPRTLGLATLALLPIIGVILLYGHYAAGRGAQSVLMSLRNIVRVTSFSSWAAGALKASIPKEEAPRPSRAARKPATSGRVKKIASSTPEPQWENAKGDIAEVIPANGSSASSQMAALPEAGSSIPSQAATPPTVGGSGSANVSPAPSTNARSDTAGSAGAPDRQPVAPGTVGPAANFVASMPARGGPSPGRAVPAASNVPSSAISAARPSAPPLRLGGSVQAAKILSQSAPTYPPVARAAGIQGLVRLEAVIAKDGTVRDLKLISGNRMLVGAALDAVRHWRYQPTELDGEPIEVRTNINVDFRLP